jgi:DnaJ-class molecular chaperone
MIGCKKKVKTLAGATLDLDIRAGVEHGTEYAASGHGFPNVNNNGYKGRFVSVVKIKTPAVIDPVIIERLKQLDDELSKRS